MNIDTIKAKGRLLITLRDENGNIKLEREFDNLVTTFGKQWIAARMTGTPTVITHMGIGTSNTAAAVGDTGLGGELVRIGLTVASTTSGVNVSQSALFSAGVGTSTTVREAGLFNASTGVNTLISRVTFGAIDKLAADSLNIAWTLTIT